MNKIVFSVMMASLCFPAWGAAPAKQDAKTETYKCIINGKVRYTDQIPDASAKCEQVFGRKKRPSAATTESDTSAADETGKPAAENGAAKGQAKPTQADKELAGKRKKLDEEVAKNVEADKQAQQRLREQNCQNATMNAQTLQMGRVARVNEKGERYFLDDATIAKELAQAKKDVEEFCK